MCGYNGLNNTAMLSTVAAHGPRRTCLCPSGLNAWRHTCLCPSGLNAWRSGVTRFLYKVKRSISDGD